MVSQATAIHHAQLIIYIEMCLCREGFPDEDVIIPSVNEIPNFANAAKE